MTNNNLLFVLIDALMGLVIFGYRYDPLIDSSDMTVEHWTRICRDIESAYYDYDGFVIVHGTDTMAYTASALSFMLENIAKPVGSNNISFENIDQSAYSNGFLTGCYLGLDGTICRGTTGQ